MIGAFPLFTPVSAQNVALLHARTKKFPNYSDLNPSNMLAWNIGDHIAVSEYKSNLIFKFKDYVQNRYFLTFIGTNEIPATIDRIVRHAKELDFDTKLRLVPEMSIQHIKRESGIFIQEDIDNHDYIINLRRLVEMTGRRHRHVRTAVKHFTQQHASDSELVPLDLDNPYDTKQILKVFQDRESARSQPNINEKTALMRLIQHQDLFKLHTYGLAIQGKLSAFIICEEQDNGFSTGHFWKADAAHKGIYPYFLRSVASKLIEKNINEMNIEQDLGIAGLRMSKGFLCPTSYLKKYTVWT